MRPKKQKLASLPADRVTPNEPPFTHVGKDYFGPFEIKQGRSIVKRYGVIFTCANSRAVYLEMAYSLTTDSCIAAIGRFVARRRQIVSIRSDNGTNLVGAERQLRQEIMKLDQSRLHNTLSHKAIDWKFNPPASSHFGGFRERLIRTVRKVLYSLLKQQMRKFDDESLQTLFCEVETVMNCRPLTKVSGDPSDLIALTPNHLLSLKSDNTYPPGTFHEKDNYGQRRWRQVQYLADQFWQRWVREYLPLLQSRQKGVDSDKNIAVGDIVLIVGAYIHWGHG